MDPNKEKNRKKMRRAKRTRGGICGTVERPRLTVCRSLRHISAQIVDDTQGKTLLALSSQSPELRDQLSYWGNAKAAGLVGKALADRAKEKGISKVTFDRGPYKYHGRVKALADGARKAGLEF